MMSLVRDISDLTIIDGDIYSMNVQFFVGFQYSRHNLSLHGSDKLVSLSISTRHIGEEDGFIISTS